MYNTWMYGVHQDFNPIIGLILTNSQYSLTDKLMPFQSHYRSDFNKEGRGREGNR